MLHTDVTDWTRQALWQTCIQLSDAAFPIVFLKLRKLG